MKQSQGLGLLPFPRNDCKYFYPITYCYKLLNLPQIKIFYVQITNSPKSPTSHANFYRTAELKLDN